MRQQSAMQREEGKVVISKSDIIILVVASSALAVGIFRWHQNTQDVSAITIPASSRAVVVEPVQNNTVPPVTVGNPAPAPTASTTQVSIPQTEPVVEIVVANTPVANEPVKPSLGTHQVRSGDYLGKIATQYGTDVQTLRDLNGISGTVIHIGEEILYPL